MLYKDKMKVKLVGELDRRRKLSDEDKNIIRTRYSNGEKIRVIARDYEKICSRRLIQFVLFPERLDMMAKKQAKEKHWKTYYNKERNTIAVREWRRYKAKII